MYKYSIKIDLLSESIFSGGESIVSIADLDVLYDEYGIPYYKAKSLKGNLRESVDMIVNNLEGENKKKFEDISQKLFGSTFNSRWKDCQDEGALRFDNASLQPEVSEYLKMLIEKSELNKDEVINSLTDIRYFTKIDKKSGVAEDGSLRSVRVLNKNISMYSDIYVEEELSEDELGLLLCGVRTLKHLGSLRSRGKGLVRCTLLKDNKNIDKNTLMHLVEKVVG